MCGFLYDLIYCRQSRFVNQMMLLFFLLIQDEFRNMSIDQEVKGK
jgi:hypothetical protein